MNKVARLLGSTALAASLTLGGSALTAGAAFANSGNDRASYSNDHRDDGRRGDDRDSRHNNYRYLYHCFDRHHDWYEWGNKYDHRWNCDLVYVRR